MMRLCGIPRDELVQRLCADRGIRQSDVARRADPPRINRSQIDLLNLAREIGYRNLSGWELPLDGGGV